MERISRRQLFCLVIMNQIGSTNIWALGIEAKQDAWIVILFSMLIGFGMVWIFTEIQKSFPEDNIAGITTSLLGNILGWPLAFTYALLYIFNATRNASEFGDLINFTFLRNTPRWFITFCLLAVIIYISYLRVETLARLTEIIVPIVIISIIAIYIMTIASGKWISVSSNRFWVAESSRY